MLPEMSSDKIVILNMCGRGDKDLEAVLPKLEERGLLSLDKGEA
jgi:tryptophan synthase beta chain